MRENSFFKLNKKELLIGAAIGVVLAVCILVFARPIMNLYYSTPAGRIYSLQALSKLICREHVYADENDDPMAIAYREYFQTDEVPEREKIKKALKAEISSDDENYYRLANFMLSHYDKYSNLNKIEIYEKMYPDNENYKGLGAGVSSCGPFLRIGSVYEDSAAGRAGLEPGDFIFSIGGFDIRTFEYTEAQKLLKTEIDKGTTLGVFRMSEDRIFMVDVSAEEVVIPNISWSIEGETAYLRVALFRGDTFEDDVDKAMKEFDEAGVKNLILDLRDDRGGYITYLEHLLNCFVEEKDVLLFTEHYRNEDMPYFSEGSKTSFEDIYVLVDGATCSSAEVVSGSLKDMGATLIGETTYGKAVGLTNYNFCGDRLVLATMTIELPKSGDYNDAGIEPNITVVNGVTELQLPECRDFDTRSDIDEESEESDILALEQRLELLAYLDGDADGIWDVQTDEALLSFTEGVGVEYSGVCTQEMINKLEELFVSLDNAVYPEDTQLLCAYSMVSDKAA